ncbi:MAG: hypothetical protein GY811_06215 [Myxococcales bacterium]|nr:hypothetical protein [Myxococcales bacterium]
MSNDSLALFLDIDGVLNSAPFLRHQRNHVPEDEHCLCAPENLRALERLCDEAEVKSIVVSSSWRTDRSIEELRFLLAKKGFSMQGRIDRATEEAPDTAEGRTEAIKAYVELHEVQRFLVLDDFHIAEVRNGIVIRCDPSRGLTDSQVPGIVKQCLALPVLPYVTRREHAVVDALVNLLGTHDDDPEAHLLNALLDALEWHLRHEWPGSRPGASYDGAARAEIVERSDRGAVVTGMAWELDGSKEDRPVPFTLSVEADVATRRLTTFDIHLDREGNDV